MLPTDTNVLNDIVARIFNIEDVTVGDPNTDRYFFRYRGKLYLEDTATAYDQLAEALKPYAVTPLFRLEEGRHVIYLVKGFPPTKPSKTWVNLVMFALTVFSVLLTGAMYGYEGTLPEDFFGQLMVFITHLANGWPFAVSMLAILLAHEFGHYLVGRYHKSNVTLPYFIPLPMSAFGTMGAFIQMKDLPKNRRTLLDIGLAGPLAGLVVAIPVLLIGLSLSKLGPVQPESALEGNSLLYLGLKYIVFGKLLPEPITYGNIPPLLYWAQYIFTSTPLPIGGLDVQLHQVAWAGWAGLLVTAMNLIPVGQLDGGHIVYVLLGKQAKKLFPLVIAVLALMGIAWTGWWLWAGLLFLVGRYHAEPLDQITELDTPRRILAVIGVIIFILVFIPVPLTIF